MFLRTPVWRSAPEEQRWRSKLTLQPLLKCIHFLIPNLIQGRVRVLCGQAGSSELQPTERVCWREGKSDTSEESPTPSAQDSCQQPTWGYSSTTHLGNHKGVIQITRFLERTNKWAERLRKCVIIQTKRRKQIERGLLQCGHSSSAGHKGVSTPFCSCSLKTWHSNSSYFLPLESWPGTSIREPQWSHLENCPSAACCLQLEIYHKGISTGVSQIFPALVQM